MADWNGNNHSICSYKDGDFDEDFDVWSAETEDSSPNMRKKNFNGCHYNSSVSSCSSSSSRRLHSSPRKIPAAAAEEEPKFPQRSSAPVNIPDWSKIYGKNRGFEDHHYGNGNGSHKVQSFDEENEDDEEELIPPHEWIAKKLSGTQLSSSVYEGIGRTLKGRDLSKLRNAILTKTGFLE